MAKATPRGGVTTNRTLKLAHSAAVADSDLILNNGQVLVSQSVAAQNVEGVFIFSGPVEVPKEAPLVIAVGDVVYFVAAANNVNKTSAGNTKAGVCIQAAASADTVVLIELGLNK